MEGLAHPHPSPAEQPPAVPRSPLAPPLVGGRSVSGLGVRGGTGACAWLGRTLATWLLGAAVLLLGLGWSTRTKTLLGHPSKKKKKTAEEAVVSCPRRGTPRGTGTYRPPPEGPPQLLRTKWTKWTRATHDIRHSTTTSIPPKTAATAVTATRYTPPNLPQPCLFRTDSQREFALGSWCYCFCCLASVGFGGGRWPATKAG